MLETLLGFGPSEIIGALIAIVSLIGGLFVNNKIQRGKGRKELEREMNDADQETARLLREKLAEHRRNRHDDVVHRLHEQGRLRDGD